jgi:LEA14-like dessication related protein
VHVRNLTLNSIDITGSFAVTNPNSFAIEFSSLRYKLDILHRTIASGTYEKTITIPEHATIGVDLPFNVSLGDVLYVAKAYLANTKDMVGEVSALAAFHTPVGAIDVTFKDSKKIQ